MNIRLLKKIRKHYRVVRTGQRQWDLLDMKMRVPAMPNFDRSLSVYQNMWRTAFMKVYGTFWLDNKRQEKRNKIWAKRQMNRFDSIMGVERVL